MSQLPLPDWFIDIRHIQPQRISLDLARHLPRRASVGPVAVIAERPTVLLSVVKKRWSIIIREVQRQYSSTLQAAKKEGLRRELERLRNYQFAIASKRNAATNILFSTLCELQVGDQFATIYLTVPTTHPQLSALMKHLAPKGFLITYTSWPDDVDGIPPHADI